MRLIAGRIANQLGPELYTACVRNDVAEVEALTSTTTPNWSAAVIAAATGEATDVAAYCLRDKRKTGIKDSALRWVLEDESLDPAYRFLVESNFIDVNHDIDRQGSLLGVIAGGKDKRHSLMQYMLQKGAIANDTVEMEGDMYALTTAAGRSDPQMVGLLLDYGAQIKGSGALIYAALRGNEDNVQYLLTRGADVNEMVPLTYYSQEDMGSPLHKAVENGHISAVNILLESGADITLKDAKGRTAADIAAQKGMDANMIARLS
jgi:hypothetical protein